MARVLAVANQKGGVAKTTTTAALSAAWAARGRKVLAVDLDPQAALTYSLGFEPDELEPTIHDVLAGRTGVADTVLTSDEGFDVAPANIDLAGDEAYLLGRTAREYALREALEDVTSRYEILVLDCPPSLGVLTINALTAADQVLIPVQAETLSRRGVAQLLSTVADIRRLTNPELRVVGLLPTMYDGRTRHARDVLSAMAVEFTVPVLAPVPKSIRFAEAPATGVSILSHSPRHAGALVYRELADEILA
ncbi:MAG: ParA family protein [Actinomycetota bacterium]